MKTTFKRFTSSAMAVAMMVTSFTFSPTITKVSASEVNNQVQFYVAVNGNDRNDGSQSTPFATVKRAKQAVAEINSNMKSDIVVNIGAGDYYLDSTLEFNEKDSGTNGYEVIYKSADGIGAANLIGGDQIKGWELADESDVSGYDLNPSLVGKVYKVQLDKDKYDFNTLYVNDKRAVMARTRNRDNNPNFPMAKGEYLRSTGGDNNNFNMKYKAGDLDPQAINGMVNAQARGEKEIAQVFVWDGGDWDWFTNTIPIQTINVTANEFKFPRDPSYPEKYRTKYNIGSGARYYLQGNLAFMDVEGEYHYNKSTGVLYYYPKTEDGNIESQTIIVPTMQEVLKFKGADKLDSNGKIDLAAVPDPLKQVHNITIDGLGLKDTEFADYFSYSWNWGDAGAGIGYPPKESIGSTNPSYCESAERPEFRVGSVLLTDANNITIKNSRIKNAGMYGIIFAGDNQYNRVENTVVEHTGNGGIMFDGGYPGIGKYNNNNTINNVLIHDVGEQVGHAVGFTLMSSGQNDITHTEIYNTPKRAILIIGGYRRDWNGADKNYDEIKDMYTVGNNLKYIHVHDAQQDAGEDSAVFLSWLLAGRDVKRLHGSNDPNNLTTNLDGIDTSIDRYNYLSQMLITDIGADPSVIEKCTAGGLDTAMGATGSVFDNIRAANTQAHLLAIRDQDGGGYGDMYTVENITNNLFTDDVLKTFDDSKMEYDKIGLTADFPSELRVSKRIYPTPPEDIYFSDDFEASTKLNAKKWTVEKGNLEMHIGFGYMSEDPLVGKRSLPINADLNPGGIVVSRTFNQPLNKIVEVKYMDRRKDYANNDRNDAVPTEILPNSFIRVDDGVNALGLGAVGRVSKDYYQIKKGDELIQTNVRRSFGWHTFKFDYTSGTDVKLYIDDQLVGTYEATSFSYIGMGDWEGIGGKAFFDQLYVYGGQEAPPVEDLPALYSVPGKLEAENYFNISGIDLEACTDADNGENLTSIDKDDWVEYNAKIALTGTYDVSYRVAIPEGKVADFDVMVDEKLVKPFNLASTNGEWQTITERISLTDGLHKIKFVSHSDSWKLNWMDFVYIGPEAPCKIEAEDFYNESGTRLDPVDEGGKGLGYIDDEDWMEYKVIVNTPGRYNINYRVSVNNSYGEVQFIANGEILKSTILPTTGGWQNWNTVSDVVEFKEAGTYTIKLKVIKGGWNINWFELLNEDETKDAMPPVTTDNAPTGWVSQDTTVTLNAVDDNSGVSATYFTVNGGAQQSGNVVTFDTEGVHTLVYWSVDNAGNIEEAHTVTVSIDKSAPEIVVTAPEDTSIIEDSGDLTVEYTLDDVLSGVDYSKTTVTLDGSPYQNETLPLYTLPLGQHTLVVSITDMAGNQSSKTVIFQTAATVDSLKALVTLFTNNNWIDNAGIANSLQSKLNNNNLNSFVNQVEAQSGKHISSEAAEYLLRDAEYVLSPK